MFAVHAPRVERMLAATSIPEARVISPMPDVTVDDILDKVAYDVNGHRLGEITLCREDDGGLRSFDVELDAAARRALQTERSTLTVAADEVVATDFDVTLAEEGILLAHPEFAPPAQLPADRL